MTEQPFVNRLTSHPRPIIVDFWAPWCAPCRWMAPVVERLETEYGGRVDVWKINADEQPDAVRSLGVIGIPTVIAFHSGKEIARRVGAASEPDLRAVFEAARSGQAPVRRGIAPADRVLRLAAGAAIIVLAFSTGPSPILLAVGGLILFTAVADRCPIWQALWPRLAALFSRGDASAD